MKAIVRTMLILLVLCAGVAWANDAELAETVAAAPEAAELAPDAAEAKPAENRTVEDLELLGPAPVEAAATCCDCWDNCEYWLHECPQIYPLWYCDQQFNQCAQQCKTCIPY